MKPRILIPLILFMFMLLIMATCSDDNPSSPAPDPNPDPDPLENPDLVTKEFGPDGGSLTSSDDQMVLTIPEGALSANETITIETIENEDLGDEFAQIIEEFGVANSYELGPDGLEFDELVTVTISSDKNVVEDDTTLQLKPELMLTSSNGTIEGVDSLRIEQDGDDLQVSGELSHFSEVITTEFLGGLITAKVSGVPDMLKDGETVIVRPHVTTSPSLNIEGISYFSDIVEGTFQPTNFIVNGSVLVKDSENEWNSPDIIQWNCKGVGEGLFKSLIRVTLSDEQDSEIILKNGRFLLKLRKPVQCVEAMQTLIVEKDGNGNGTVISQPEGISCGADCQEDQADFEEGSSVILAAEPADGSVFDGWGGDTGDSDIQDSTLTVIMDSARTVTAIFGQKSDPGGSSLKIEEFTANAVAKREFEFRLRIQFDGEEENLRATIDPDDGSGEQEVVVNRVENQINRFNANLNHSYDGGSRFTPKATVTDTATNQFEELRFTIDEDSLNVIKEGNGSGTVTGIFIDMTTVIDCGENCTTTVLSPDFRVYGPHPPVRLTATPDEGSVFTGWSGDTEDDEGNTCDTTGECKVNMNNDRTVTATFNKDVPAEITSLKVNAINSLQVQTNWTIQINFDGSITNLDLEFDWGDDTSTDINNFGVPSGQEPQTFTGETTHTYNTPGRYNLNLNARFKDVVADDSATSFTTPAPPEITELTGKFIDLRKIDVRTKMRWAGGFDNLSAKFDGNSDSQNTMDVQLEEGDNEQTINAGFDYEFSEDLDFPVMSSFVVTNTKSDESNSTFVEVQEVSLNVMIEGNGTVTGTVLSSLQDEEEIINCNPDCDQTFLFFPNVANVEELIEIVNLTAQPAEGYKFDSWSGDIDDNEFLPSCIPEEPNCELAMTQNRTVTATFSKKLVLISQIFGNILGDPESLIPLTLPFPDTEKVASTNNTSESGENTFSSSSTTAASDVQFGDISGSFPVAIAGAEGFVVVDLLTNQVLLEVTQDLSIGRAVTGVPAFGVIGLSQEPPGPGSPAVFLLHGETGFSFWETDGGGFIQQINQPPAFDAFPAGGNLFSGYAVTVNSSAVDFVTFDEADNLFKFTSFEDNINSFLFDGSIISAWMPDDGTPEDTPVLVLDNATESGLYLALRDGSAPTRVADVGPDARKVRCTRLKSGMDNFVCAVSVFGSNQLAILTWDGATAPTFHGFTNVGNGPVDIQLRRLINGNVAVLSTGFNDNTVTETEVAPDGTVISNNTRPTLEGCESPAHAIYIQDDESLKIVGTCFGSDAYFITESDLE